MSPRLCGVASLALLGIYTLAMALAAQTSGLTLATFASYPLGGGPAAGGLLASGTALALTLVLGWGIPGLALAQLSQRHLEGFHLLARALTLGTGYVVLTSMAHTLIVGRAPSRAALLVLLALPPLISALRGGVEPHHRRPLFTALTLMLLLTALLWSKLRYEGLNGDGTEAYELARSLDSHVLPRWDMERWDPPGRFGIPLVNPFVTNSYLVHAGMTIAGRGELAPRLPFIPALVLGGLLATGALRRATFAEGIYAGAVLALYGLWNVYYVGYEAAFTDLAEPAATDTLMLALWLAGFVEIVAGARWAGITALLLSAGILYSSPILTTAALATLSFTVQDPRGRILAPWLAALAGVTAVALAVGAATGDLGDWVRQIRGEYWNDFVDATRRSPTLPLVGRLLLLTGGLPLCALVLWRRLSPPGRALLVTALIYLGIVCAGSYKNLHYLAPLPFLLILPALESSGRTLRTIATGVVVCGLVLSWPSSTETRRETIDLGRVSCIQDLGYEEACLAADVVYQAFGQPGMSTTFTVGKHTFVRYALELGGQGCVFQLSRHVPPGWTRVAGHEVALSVRDMTAYEKWRHVQPPATRSLLLPRFRP